MKVFISYRRADSQYVADSIYDHMMRHFGRANVFLDVGSIPPGVDFRVYLHEQIAAHDVVLVLIGPEWGRIMQERSAQANDFVRIEIENALKLGKLVIPVQVMNATMPDFSNLPASIQDLQWRNAVVIRRQPDFENDCSRLAEGIRKHFQSRENTVVSAPGQAQSRVPAVIKTFETINPNLESLEEALERAWNFKGTKNSDWTPYIHTFDGVEMCLVPCGKFMMGSEDGKDNEKPVHEQIFARPFWLDRYPVTNAEYKKAVDAGVTEEPIYNEWYKDEERTNHPVVCVTSYQVRRYAQWRGSVSKRHYRLPTEREWEYAARGVSNLIYPWGNDYIPDNAILGKSSNPGDITTYRSGKSWVDAFHLIGNVWEWCSPYEVYPYDSEDEKGDINRTNISFSGRGGSWRNTSLVSASFRRSFTPDDAFNGLGFRLILSVK